MTFGVAIPVTLKGAPRTVIMEIVRSAVPVFDNVMFEVVLLPTVALPASRFVGLTVNLGCGVAAVAATGIAAVTDALSPWKVSVPVVLPVAEPVNHTRKFAVCAGASVKGKVKPEIVN